MKKVLIFSSTVISFIMCCFIAITANAQGTVDISNAKITLSKTSYTYNADEHTPTVYLALDGEKLVKNKDFTVSYSNNINAGEGKVVVTGIGNYTGTVKASFNISPQKISKTSISRDDFKIYVGQTPTYTVKYKGSKLKAKKDYVVSISNNKKVGIKTANVTIKGNGNFTGKKTFKLTIRPSKVKGVTASSRTSTTVTLKWDSQNSTGITGYKVYSCDENGENRELVGKTTKNKLKITGLKTGKVNYFVVRSYYVSGDTTLYGNYSKVRKTCTKPEKVSIMSASKSSNKTKLVVKWQKTRCTGYIIEYSTDKKFENKVKTVVVKDANKTSKKIKISKNNKTYYVRVRAYRTYKINNKKYTLYGKRSAKLSTTYNILYASFSTSHSSSASRQTNLKVACKYINGTILLPGETFSFNNIVGPRTASRGFKKAPVFTGSTGSALGYGGGVCQVATTLFNTALRANVGIVERYQHSQKVSYVPYGMDAAISGTAKNLQFKNTTGYPIKIVMSASGGTVYCKFYVSTNVKPQKVKLKVTRSGNLYTLKRSVNGVVNYTTYSRY